MNDDDEKRNRFLIIHWCTSFDFALSFKPDAAPDHKFGCSSSAVTLSSDEDLSQMFSCDCFRLFCWCRWMFIEWQNRYQSKVHVLFMSRNSIELIDEWITLITVTLYVDYWWYPIVNHIGPNRICISIFFAQIQARDKKKTDHDRRSFDHLGRNTDWRRFGDIRFWTSTEPYGVSSMTPYQDRPTAKIPLPVEKTI